MFSCQLPHCHTFLRDLLLVCAVDSSCWLLSLSPAHSKALSSYRQVRRKYREQVWRLEQKVAAMAEGQQPAGTPTPAEEFSEWRREETVL